MVLDLLSGIDDFNKFRFQGGTAYQETINIGLGGQFFAVGSGYRATILNAERIRNFLGDVFGQPFAQVSVNFLGLKIRVEKN